MSLEHFLKDRKTMSRMRAGLFGPYVDGFAEQLRDRGYSNAVAGLHLRLIYDFGQWVQRKHVAEAELSLAHVQRYVKYRQRERQPTGCDASAVKEFIQFLRGGQTAAEENRDNQLSACELVTEGFVRYLSEERALSPATISYYKEFARRFLVNRFGAGDADLTALCAADVLCFMQDQVASNARTKRAKLIVTALRSFFRYLRYKGSIDTDLASIVPAVAEWSKASLPKAISADQVERVVLSRSGSTATERRDYATFLLLARLGLRAGEIVSLTLDDIDWQQGCITIRGKGGSRTKMPLPMDAGEATAEYLLKARPQSTLRSVFLTVRAPIAPLTVSGLSTRVRYALDALGIEAPSRGTHLFRHSLATNMLRRGASLAEIGELLRHKSTQTTEVYAKVDLIALRQLALPWPGGVK